MVEHVFDAYKSVNQSVLAINHISPRGFLVVLKHAGLQG